MADAGNRVRTVPNERLDEPDFDAVSALIYAWTQYAMGGTEGVAEGCLSPPSVAYEVVGPVRQIRLGSAVLYAAQNDGAATNQAQALPVVYNPADANQLQSTIDLSAYPNAGGAIWWTVALTQSDLANRRVWASGYPDGKPVAITTRYTQRINFATSADFNTAPATPGTWFRMGAFFLPTSGAPTVAWLHAGDWGGQTDMTGLIASGAAPAIIRVGRWIFDDGYNSANNVGRAFGAYRLISQLAARVLTMMDSDWEFDPQTLEVTSTGTATLDDAPLIGLLQTSTEVDGLSQSVSDLNVRYRLAYFARVASTAAVTVEGGDIITTGYATCTVSSGGAGVFNFVFSSVLASSTALISVSTNTIDLGEEDVTTRYTVNTTSSITVYTNHIGAGLANYAFSVQVMAQGTAYE